MFQFTKEQRKWIDTLKNGRFPQSVGYLKSIQERKVGYCCLGVACQLFKDKVGLDVKVEPYDAFPGAPRHYLFNDSSGTLPSKMEEFLGIESSGDRNEGYKGYYRFNKDSSEVKFIREHDVPASVKTKFYHSAYLVKHGQYTYWQTAALSSFNDNGMTFREIALILETYPEHYLLEEPNETISE